ncbi:pilus assembly protein, partial [Rhizobium ruizarguesonis]
SFGAALPLLSGSAASVGKTALNRIVRGSEGVCNAGTDPRPGICDLNWRITPDKLMVTYQRSGLGYWGRPDGPVLKMRLEVRNITFDL